MFAGIGVFTLGPPLPGQDGARYTQPLPVAGLPQLGEGPEHVRVFPWRGDLAGVDLAAFHQGALIRPVPERRPDGPVRHALLGSPAGRAEDVSAVTHSLPPSRGGVSWTVTARSRGRHPEDHPPSVPAADVSLGQFALCDRAVRSDGNSSKSAPSSASATLRRSEPRNRPGAGAPSWTFAGCRPNRCSSGSPIRGPGGRAREPIGRGLHPALDHSVRAGPLGGIGAGYGGMMGSGVGGSGAGPGGGSTAAGLYSMGA